MSPDHPPLLDSDRSTSSPLSPPVKQLLDTAIYTGLPWICFSGPLTLHNNGLLAPPSPSFPHRLFIPYPKSLFAITTNLDHPLEFWDKILLCPGDCYGRHCHLLCKHSRRDAAQSLLHFSDHSRSPDQVPRLIDGLSPFIDDLSNLIKPRIT
jgi:hypothetical protein